MFGFFDSFKKGCGCALGVMTGLIIAAIAIALVSGTCEINGL